VAQLLRMDKNFKLIIEYDGTNFHGWQRQKKEATIQGEIEKALWIMTRNRVTLTGSGRTDAGVHAVGQAANFRCDTNLAPDAFQRGLNSLLPQDIVIKECCQVEDTFHARYNVKSKIYHYKIFNRTVPTAIHRRYVWSIRRQLDTRAMRTAISYIIGSQDFKAFEGAGSPRAHTTRHVMAADLVESDSGLLTFRIEADGFLRFMVRNIVGTLVDVGLGKTLPAEFEQILKSRDRTKAGATAPASGLCLMEVKY
jgi:tRNA pseudouridine38-40 synthase